MTTYVVVGLSNEQKEDTEVIGPFASKKEAKEWCVEYGMYDPHVIVRIMSSKDSAYTRVLTLTEDNN